MSINIGSTIATLLTPIFRSDIKCFGDQCYPLSFGVPTAFMFMAIIFFAMGTKHYKREIKKEGGNIIVQSVGCISRGLYNKLRGYNSSKTHWLECADDKYSKQLISDVQIVLKVLLTFSTAPLFWALYDQQGSNWTNQAQQLSGRLGSWTIKPDQFQAVNPILIIILVPIFDLVIYPLFAKCGLLRKQLSRMAFGYIFGIFAFGISAILEFQMQAAFNNVNPIGRVQIVNLSPCNILINNQPLGYKVPIDFSKNLADNQARFNYSCMNAPMTEMVLPLIKEDNMSKLIYITYDNVIKSNEYRYTNTGFKKGFSKIRFNDLTGDYNDSIPYLVRGSTKTNYTFSDTYYEIDYEEYKLELNSTHLGEYLFEICGKYLFFIFKNDTQTDAFFFHEIDQNGLHIGWQIIQIFVMSIGEIMFSVSGLTFAYSQAPTSMKSVLQACWLLCVAFGNVIVVIMVEILKAIKDVYGEFNQGYENLVYTALLLIATICYILIIYFAKYDEKLDDEKKETGEKKEMKKTNTFADVYPEKIIEEDEKNTYL